MGLRLSYFQTAAKCSPVGHLCHVYGRTPVAPASPCPLRPTRAAGRMAGKNGHFSDWQTDNLRYPAKIEDVDINNHQSNYQNCHFQSLRTWFPEGWKHVEKIGGSPNGATQNRWFIDFIVTTFKEPLGCCKDHCCLDAKPQGITVSPGRSREMGSSCIISLKSMMPLAKSWRYPSG